MNGIIYNNGKGIMKAQRQNPFVPRVFILSISGHVPGRESTEFYRLEHKGVLSIFLEATTKGQDGNH